MNMSISVQSVVKDFMTYQTHGIMIILLTITLTFNFFEAKPLSQGANRTLRGERLGQDSST